MSLYCSQETRIGALQELKYISYTFYIEYSEYYISYNVDSDSDKIMNYSNPI